LTALRPTWAGYAVGRPGPDLGTWEPVSGFEPLTCRLQEVRPSAPRALPAPIAQPGARMALPALGSSGWPFHDAFHATIPVESAWEVTPRVPTRRFRPGFLPSAGLAGRVLHSCAGPLVAVGVHDGRGIRGGGESPAHTRCCVPPWPTTPMRRSSWCSTWPTWPPAPYSRRGYDVAKVPRVLDSWMDEAVHGVQCPPGQTT